MIGFLLLLNIVFPLAILASAWRRDGVVLKHTHLFAFGYLFYWILPVGLGAMIPPAMLAEGWQGWTSLVLTVPSAALAEFLALAILCFGAFMLGDSAARRVRAAGIERSLSLRIPRNGFFLLLLPLIPLWLGLVLALRDQLFRGYAGRIIQPWDVDPLRGAYLATCALLLAVALFSDACERREGREMSRRMLARQRRLAVTVYVFAAVLELSLGRRIALASGAVVFAVYYSVFVRPLRTAWVGIGALVGVLGLGAFGMLRFGTAPSIVGTVQNVLTEPLYDSFSLIFLLGNYKIPLLKFPSLLLGQFVNVIPTFLFPGKAAALLKPEDVGYVEFSPIGGTSSFFSLVVNFGGLGGVVMMFLFGATLRALSNMGGALVTRVMYAMSCGCVAFSFFHDPFSVSIVKELFEFAWLAPLAMLVSVHVLWCPGRLAESRANAIRTSPEVPDPLVERDGAAAEAAGIVAVKEPC